eukprot:243876_1
MASSYNQRSSILSISRYQTQHRHSNGRDRLKHNLKISNLPSHLNDMAIISSFKQLMDPIATRTDFKKIIFRRAPDGKAFLFVKFATPTHVMFLKLKDHLTP